MVCFILKTPTSQFHLHIFAWWKNQGRVLPWRDPSYQARRGSLDVLPTGVGRLSHTQLREEAFESYFAGNPRDPYRVVVSEVMLQQTQVDRVISKYQMWMEKWPTIYDLANAELSEVIIAWQGLGYNRRARFLWLLSKEITENREGVWPTEEAELLKLPGVGRYTARAIMSFAFGKQVGVVDVNVKRVLGRWLGVEKTGKEWFILADEFLPTEQADPWNQSLMDFGALICTAKSPKCESCPVSNICSVNQWAISRGCDNYAGYLRELKTDESGQIHPQGALPDSSKKRIKFRDSDRFFRGRIIDLLRDKSHDISIIQQILRKQYLLDDADRFHQILQKLQEEGLVTIKDDVAKLG